MDRSPPAIDPTLDSTGWCDDTAWTDAWTGSGGGAAPIAKHRHDYVVPSDVAVPRRLDQDVLLRWMTRFTSGGAASVRDRSSPNSPHP